MARPLPRNSDHQDYSIFNSDPYKPLFATVTGKGPHPIYTNIFDMDAKNFFGMIYSFAIPSFWDIHLLEAS